MSTNYRRSAFTASRRRKRPTANKNFGSPDMKRLNDYLAVGCSWYGQDTEDKNSENQSFSASRKKLLMEQVSDTESDDISSNDDENERDDEVVTADCWIIDVNILSEYLKEVCVCSVCHGSLSFEEVDTARAGLGTKFTLICENRDCATQPINKSFNTTRKSGQVYEINRKSVLASRLAGTGRNGLLKICSVLGLNSPVWKQSFAEHTKYWDKVAAELREENQIMAAQRAKKFEAKGATDTVVDIPTSFDGSWYSRGWTANKGFVSAIAESTSQVLDVILKIRSCPQCTIMENKRKEGKCTAMQYLNWFIDHEDECLLNHDGSPQVSDTNIATECDHR